MIWRLADLAGASSAELFPAADQPAPSLPPKVAAQVRSLAANQANALQELLAYQAQSGSQGLALLQTRMDTRRRQYRQTVDELAAAASAESLPAGQPTGQPLYNYRLFELSDEQWSTLERNAEQVFAEMMTQGIHKGMPDDLLRRAIELRVPTGTTPEVRQLTADVVAASLVANLVRDEERTRLRADQAVNEIAPVMVSAHKGEVIVRANEVIDQSDFVLLDYFDLTGRYFNWIGLCGFSLLMAAAVAFYLWVDHQQVHQLNRRDHGLVLLLCLVVSGLAALRVPTLGLPAVGLLVGSFYGSALGLTVVGLLTLLLPVGLSVKYNSAGYGRVSGDARHLDCASAAIARRICLIRRICRPLSSRSSPSADADALNGGHAAVESRVCRFGDARAIWSGLERGSAGRQSLFRAFF